MTTRTRRIADGTRGDKQMRQAVGEVAASTVRLSTVDPVTTEIVRVRCAHHHDCHT